MMPQLHSFLNLLAIPARMADGSAACFRQPYILSGFRCIGLPQMHTQFVWCSLFTFHAQFLLLLLLSFCSSVTAPFTGTVYILQCFHLKQILWFNFMLMENHFYKDLDLIQHFRITWVPADLTSIIIQIFNQHFFVVGQWQKQMCWRKKKAEWMSWLSHSQNVWCDCERVWTSVCCTRQTKLGSKSRHNAHQLFGRPVETEPCQCN